MVQYSTISLELPAIIWYEGLGGTYDGTYGYSHLPLYYNSNLRMGEGHVTDPWILGSWDPGIQIGYI